MNYTVESKFEWNGYECVVIMGHMGHRCGYVGIPKTHILWGCKYDENRLPRKDVENEDIGKRGIISLMIAGGNKLISPMTYFDVHGSITYSDKGNYPIENDCLWWFGYDCGHFGDGIDLSVVQNPLIRQALMFCNDGEVRSNYYCVEECKSLAKQLYEYNSKYQKIGRNET